MSAPIIDGNFTAPVEIEGSGVRTFSQYNTADFLVDRLYVQERISYRPIPISSTDRVYPKAYMVEDSVLKTDGAFAYIKRTFMTIPSPRMESKNIVYTFPGESLQSITVVDGKIVYSWDRYGAKKPASVFRSANLAYTYSLGQVAVDLPTQILLDDSPVDFVGFVFAVDGQTLIGVTSPSVSPGTFIVSDNCHRLRGDIWERERVTVSLGSGGPIFTP